MTGLQYVMAKAAITLKLDLEANEIGLLEPSSILRDNTSPNPTSDSSVARVAQYRREEKKRREKEKRRREEKKRREEEKRRREERREEEKKRRREKRRREEKKRKKKREEKKQREEEKRRREKKKKKKPMVVGGFSVFFLYDAVSTWCVHEKSKIPTKSIIVSFQKR
ncbi:hypothetical protein FQA39_LY03368 [Lamprigera yunnana]|nr:hypothetical protein FQA39_LY03368 [Lamprigera yunnana]